MLRRVGVLLATLLFVSAPAWANTDVGSVRKKLLALQPDLVIDEISPAAKLGWYQVQVRGGQFLYVDENVEYLFYGQLYRVQENTVVNLTEQAQQKFLAAQLKALPEKDMIVFPAAHRRARVTVFTDVDCSYCQKLHDEVQQLNEMGIEVRYLAYPRLGLNGRTYTTMVSVWCADDRQAAMTQAKRQLSVQRKDCKHPIDRQLALGQMIGVQGTPTIILESGELLPGYLSAEQLAARAIKN